MGPISAPRTGNRGVGRPDGPPEPERFSSQIRESRCDLTSTLGFTDHELCRRTLGSFFHHPGTGPVQFFVLLCLLGSTSHSKRVSSHLESLCLTGRALGAPAEVPSCSDLCAMSRSRRRREGRAQWNHRGTTRNFATWSTYYAVLYRNSILYPPFHSSVHRTLTNDRKYQSTRFDPFRARAYVAR